jgi:hypothetical protein
MRQKNLVLIMTKMIKKNRPIEQNIFMLKKINKDKKQLANNNIVKNQSFIFN